MPMGLVELLLPSTAPAKVARRSAYFTARAPALDHLPALEYFQPGRTLRLSLFSAFPAARRAAHTHMQQQHARTRDAPNPPPRAFMAALRTVKTEYEKSICASGCENPVCGIDAWKMPHFGSQNTASGAQNAASGAQNAAFWCPE